MAGLPRSGFESRPPYSARAPRVPAESRPPRIPLTLRDAMATLRRDESGPKVLPGSPTSGLCSARLPI